MQEDISEPNRPAKDPANHIASFDVGGQLAIGNGKSNRTEVICHYPHGNICFGIRSIGYPGHVREGTDQWQEYIGVVVGNFSLQYHTESFESHTGVNMFGWQRNQPAIGLPVKFNEHQVPDLNDQGIIGVHQFTARKRFPFLVRPQVDVDLRTGTAGPGITHLPEVVFFGPEQDMLIGDKLLPIGKRVSILCQTIGLISFKNSYV